MDYEIHITRAAEKDLNSAADYIELVLFNPQAANDLVDEAAAQIGELAVFPKKFSLVDDPVLNAWGIRFATVKNYLAFYTISEQEHRVYLVRFLSGKRDWVSILKHGFSLE